MVTLIRLLCTAPDPMKNPAWLNVCATLLLIVLEVQRTIVTHMWFPLRREQNRVSTLTTIVLVIIISRHTFVLVVTLDATV